MFPKPLYSIADAQQVGLLETQPQGQQILMKAPSGYVRNPDVLGQMRHGFENFVQTGQIWALILGFVLGFMLSGVRRG